MRSHFTIAALAAALALALPTPAMAVQKRLAPDGSIPKQYNLPKPDLPPHPDVAPITAGGGDGSGKNSLSFSAFDDGDMVVALGTATGHAGEWDAYYYTKYSQRIGAPCVWSANTTPVNGVQREAPLKYRNYDYAYGVWVPSSTPAQRVAARNYCRAQNGERYVITSSKADQSRWYCSKLLWASYKYAGPKIDLDANGGYWVWPEDLVKDSQTAVFAAAR